ATSRLIVAAAAPAGAPTPLQRSLVEAVVSAMTGHPARVPEAERTPLEELATVLARRNAAYRTRILQLAVLSALVLRPIPPAVADRVDAMARVLAVDEGMLAVARRLASGSLGLAAFDFERNGYTAEWHPDDAAALHTSGELADAWALAPHDPGLAERWRALEEGPADSLGRRITDFYRARGFAYPGLPGSAPPLLAQHDWVHVVADYGTTVESELEVFAFIARANDDMRAFSLLAMVVSLFETGALRRGAGLFESDTGHLSRAGVTTRLADAMRRGARCHGSVDYLRTDWFELAGKPVAEVQESFGIQPKSEAALEAGSVGPFEAGGISPFQLAAGRSMAEAEGRPYDAFGATAPPSTG
ncbi:MAG TPA: hypothetical protein VKW77_11235, partial [Acidimicrobiales bacterium]|nr:hypothetical protein [Acidimicrobiales bacterium]